MKLSYDKYIIYLLFKIYSRGHTISKTYSIECSVDFTMCPVKYKNLFEK